MRFQFFIYIILAALAASWCPPAVAEWVYIGVGAARFTDDGACQGTSSADLQNCLDQDIETTVMGYLGLNLPITSFGVEAGHIMLPEGEDAINSSYGTTSSITYGAVTLHLKVFPGIRLSLLGGLGQASYDGEPPTLSSEDGEPFYGLGVRVSPGEHLGLSARYQSFRPGDDDEISGISLGLEYRF